MMAVMVMGVAVGALMALMPTTLTPPAAREDCGSGAGAGAGIGARSDAGVCGGAGAVRGQLSLVQNSAACGGALYKRAGQARDDRVGEPLRGPGLR
jgi:hypothetical protein